MIYSFDEVQVDAVLPTGEPQVEQNVCSPDCGKQVSAKSLKYRHGPNCVVKKETKAEPTHRK